MRTNRLSGSQAAHVPYAVFQTVAFYVLAALAVCFPCRLAIVGTCLASLVVLEAWISCPRR